MSRDVEPVEKAWSLPFRKCFPFSGRFCSNYQPPHGPFGSPHLPQPAPNDGVAGEVAPLLAEKTLICLETFLLPHVGQLTEDLDELSRINASNTLSHSGQWNSRIGISQAPIKRQRENRASRPVASIVGGQGADNQGIDRKSRYRGDLPKARRLL